MHSQSQSIEHRQIEDHRLFGLSDWVLDVADVRTLQVQYEAQYLMSAMQAADAINSF